MARARNPITMADADKEDAVMVAVTRDGKVFLSPGAAAAAGRLGEKVKDLLTNKPTKLVYLRADRAPSTRWWKTWSTTCAPRAWISWDY